MCDGIEPKTDAEREKLNLHLDDESTGIQPKGALDILINWAWALTFAALATLLSYFFLK